MTAESRLLDVPIECKFGVSLLIWFIGRLKLSPSNHYPYIQSLSSLLSD